VFGTETRVLCWTKIERRGTAEFIYSENVEIQGTVEGSRNGRRPTCKGKKRQNLYTPGSGNIERKRI
jgi:hypothetical protein